MKDTHGYIVEYTTKEGKKQKALMLLHEQTQDYTKYNRVFLHLLNDDLTPMKNEEGKKLISVRYVSELTRIGFQD